MHLRSAREFLRILTTLNRKPSAQEREKFAAFLADEKASVADAIWTLITCSEFRFNH